jgi:hypothetical protein
MNNIDNFQDDITYNENNIAYKMIKNKFCNEEFYSLKTNYNICIYETKIFNIEFIHYCNFDLINKSDLTNIIKDVNLFEFTHDPNIMMIIKQQITEIETNTFSYKYFHKRNIRIFDYIGKYCIFPELAFLITFWTIYPNKSYRKILLDSYYEWIKLNDDTSKINWILQKKYNKNTDININIIHTTLLSFFETIHKNITFYHLNKLDYTKINFIIGKYVSNEPYTKNFINDNDDLSEIINLEIGLVHSQLYFNIKNKFYKYDSDIITLAEKNSLKLNIFNLINIKPIQNNDDTFCIFYCLKFIIIFCTNNINKINKKTISLIENKIGTNNSKNYFDTKNGLTKSSNKIIDWINDFYKECIINNHCIGNLQ